MENTKAKHGIVDEDTYNFNAFGFMTGVILIGAVITNSEYLCRYTLSGPTWIGPGGNVTCTLL